MKTRFDGTLWIDANNNERKLESLDTDHLMNIIRMFVTKPMTTMNMLISDIEQASDMTAWTRRQDSSSLRKLSIQNVTNMSINELIDYALNSLLGKAIVKELSRRGVNVINVINIALASNEVMD